MENKIDESLEKESVDTQEEVIEEGNGKETLEECEVNEDKEFEEVDEDSSLNEENLKLKEENKVLNNKINAVQEKHMRLTAEYDNYRKRTVKEKEGIYTDACADVLKDMLPVIDNLERAIAADGSDSELKKGVEMTLKQFNDALGKLNVEEIPSDGKFDPNVHNAVMHVQGEEYGENEIVEVFQKGYKRGEKVLRYSMVKVAN